METIAVATDFSSRSDRAVRRAAALAKQFGATLHLIHIVDEDWHKQLLSISLRESETLLKDKALFIREKEAVHCTTTVKAGDPATGIVTSAAELGAELLVVGPHRREFLRDIFVGTTVERIVRSSRIPVLVAAGGVEKAYSRIVVAVDLSPCSAEALQAVNRLGLRRAAELWTLYCAPTFQGSGAALAALSDDEIASYVNAERTRAVLELDEFSGPLGIPEDHRIARLAQGSTAASVLKAAEEMRADLIAVGTHGRTGIERLMLGSVATAILAAAQIDVIAVPPSPDYRPRVSPSATRPASGAQEKP